MDAPGEWHPNSLPRPLPYDNERNPFVTIVDVSGIHHLPIVGCLCESHLGYIDLPYVQMGLFPTSFECIQTLFTLAVLKDFRLSNLECKTSAYQYYQKLRRLTCPAFPKAVLNRYRELRRLSREYRNLQLWKMHGRAHDEPMGPTATVGTLSTSDGIEHWEDIDDVPRGKLSSFCPACPQPGINLPPGWKDDPDRYVYDIFILKCKLMQSVQREIHKGVYYRW